MSVWIELYTYVILRSPALLAVSRVISSCHKETREKSVRWGACFTQSVNQLTVERASISQFFITCLISIVLSSLWLVATSIVSMTLKSNMAVIQKRLHRYNLLLSLGAACPLHIFIHFHLPRPVNVSCR